MKIVESIYTDLGFNTIREWLAKKSNTEINSEVFLNLSPISDKIKLSESNQLTEELLNGLCRKEILPISYISNSESWMNQLSIQGSQLNPNSFKNILNLLIQSRKLKKSLSNVLYPNWLIEMDALINLEKGEQKIHCIFDDTFEVKPGSSEQLFNIYRNIENTKNIIESRLNSLFKQAQSSGWLQDNHIAWNNGRSVLPMKAIHKRKIKGIIQSQSATGKTIFIEPLEIIELNNDLTNLEFTRLEEIKCILKDLTKFFANYRTELFTTIHLIIKFDFHYTIAKLAYHTDSVAPFFSEKNNLIFEDARNPILELGGKNVVPLNLTLTNKDKILLLSGPNAGGKTVTLKTVGLFSIMAQCELFIPAKKCEIPIFKQLLCDIGDQQSIEDDLSTFSAHIKNLTLIAKAANKKTLILLDELGTGTDPDAGAAISQAIMQYILEKGSFMFATTHLGALKSWAHKTEKVTNGGMIFDPNKLVPTYELQLGYPGASYALEIARRMGLNHNIINHAKQLLGDNSVKLEEVLRTLEVEQQKSKVIIEKLNHREKIIDKKEYNLKCLDEKIKKKYKKANLTAAKEAEIIIKNTRREMENLIAQIRSSNANSNTIKLSKQKINQSIEKLKKYKIHSSEKKFIPLTIDEAKVGELVYIPHLNMEGIITNPPNNQKKITVQCNGINLTLKCNQTVARKKRTPKIQSPNISTHTVNRLQSMQLDLRGLRLEPALLKLEKFLDKALLLGMNKIDILHGKGTGVLMGAVSEFLKQQPFVKSFNFAQEDHGGAGITEVEFK